MVVGFGLSGSIPLHSLHFRGFAWLNGRSLNGGANFIGFHGAYMGFFFGGLYRRKLGFILIVDSVPFLYSETATKSGAKVVYLCRQNYFVFPLSLAIGS